MVKSNLKVLAKFGPCSNCSQKLDECSLARARKIFATARMLGFSLNFPTLLRKHNLQHWGSMRAPRMLLERLPGLVDVY